MVRISQRRQQLDPICVASIHLLDIMSETLAEFQNIKLQFDQLLAELCEQLIKL